MSPSRLRSLLAERFGLSARELSELAEEATRANTDLAETALRRGLVSRDQLLELSAQELNIPYVDVANAMIDPEVLTLVPGQFCRQRSVLPLFRIGSTITVAMANPADIAVLDELHQRLQMEVNPALADPVALKDAVERYYGAKSRETEQAAAIAIEAEAVLRTIETDRRSRSLEELASEAPVVRLVGSLLEQAVADRASDIHVEPEEDTLRIRVRVDGLMRPTATFPSRLHPALVSRVKILSALDISERRRPQDGQFEYSVNGHSFDVRVSTFPTVYGENLVMRLLDKSSVRFGLSELGLSPEAAAHFETHFRQPHGMILVTGPTGSGKTTTLYSVLNALNSEDKNIITLEDPVEYHLPMVRQCQVNVKAGVTFATGLRSILRQDPDVIMVGEIRDVETAEVGFQAALTGHLVLSTLHTNDAAGALTRMIDMGVEPFLISSSIIAILAQRLVRRVCDRCVETYVPAPEYAARLGLESGVTFVRGKGCNACGGLGFRGRLGVFELLVMTPDIRRMVMNRRPSEEIKSFALTQGMKTLRDDAIAKALAGLTTPEEVLRVTQDRQPA